MPRQRPVYIKKPKVSEEQPTLACPHCTRKLTGTKTGKTFEKIHRSVVIPTVEMEYPCEHCGIIIQVDVAVRLPKPEVVDFGTHYVTDEFTLKPLVE